MDTVVINGKDGFHAKRIEFGKWLIYKKDELIAKVEPTAKIRYGPKLKFLINLKNHKMNSEHITVGELINILSTYNPALPVLKQDGIDGNGYYKNILRSDRYNFGVCNVAPDLYADCPKGENGFEAVVL